MSHVELANRGTRLGAMGDAVNHESAGATNSFAAVVVEGDRFFTLQDQVLVQYIQHLEERHVGVYFRVFVPDHLPDVRSALLPPNVEDQSHYL
jgi:hypothetical protein